VQTLVDVLPYLRCPVCGAAFPSEFRCTAGHTFDIARQGYVNLLPGHVRHAGDSAAMVAARSRFLGAGHYRFVVDAMAALARRLTGGGGLVVDVGGGTGYHLAGLLAALPDAVGLNLDASKAAARRAAHAHPRAAAAVCDAWSRLPLADGCATLVANVFAPRNGPEFHRVLRPDGILLTVTPDAGHLAELVAALALLHVDPSKPDRLAASLADFTVIDARSYARTLRLSRPDVRALVAMGPSAHHHTPEALDRAIAALPDPVAVTVAVRVAAHRPRPRR
jgi:23S rRNA (guanine745-N1)-methyltransferase